MKRHIVGFILMLLTSTLAAQEKAISGRVVDTHGRPVAAASVLLLSDKGAHLKLTKTDKDGHFSITPPAGKTIAKIAFVHMGYERQDLMPGQFAGAKHMARLEEKVQTIREVEVKPELFRVKGDTITYSVAGLREKQDRSIEDVIKRIPDIKVSTNGGITYKGKSIAKFYVDGKDMMGDSYAMVSKNLSADKVDSVEVLQRHVVEKSLRGISFSEAASLNLVLKKSAKGKWNGTAEVGSGLALQQPWGWNRRLRIVGMYFGGTWQSLNMYKHNNVGDDISEEVKGLTVGTASSGLTNLCGIGHGRYGFNNSHLIASNWFWKHKKSTTFRLQLAGLYDKSTIHNYSEQTFIDIDGGGKMVQERRANAYTNEYKGDVEYMYNGEHATVNSQLRVGLNYDHSNATTTLNGTQRHERVLPRERGIKENLCIIKRYGWVFTTLRSNLSYTYSPGTLRLYNGTDEVLNGKDLTWTNEYSIMGRNRKNYSWGGSINYDIARKSKFVAYNDTTDNATYHEDKLSVSAHVELRKGYTGNRIKFTLRQTYLSRRLDKEVDKRYIFEPMADFKLTLKRIATIEGRYTHIFSPSGFEMNALRIYTSYNMASAGVGKNTHTQGDNAQLKLSTSILKWRWETNYQYSHIKAATLYESTLAGGVYIRENTARDNAVDHHSVGSTLSRDWERWHTKLTLGGSYSWSAYDIMVNRQQSPAGNNHLSASLSLSMRPSRLFNFEERSSFSMNRQHSVYSKYLFRNFFHTLNLYLTPGKWVAAMANECSHSADQSEKFNLYSSAYIAYKTQKYELRLDGKNLWGYNKREYKSVTVLGTSYSVTEFRPREILATITLSM